MDTRLADALKVSAKAFVTTLTVFLLGSIAHSQPLREENLLVIPAYIGLVAFGARWFRILRTREEFEQQKAHGEYRKFDEFRRAVVIVAFGVLGLVSLNAIVSAIEIALR